MGPHRTIHRCVAAFGTIVIRNTEPTNIPSLPDSPTAAQGSPSPGAADEVSAEEHDCSGRGEGGRIHFSHASQSSEPIIAAF